MSAYNNSKYTEDKIPAIDAKFEAQKIAFAPLAFQAVRALLELGLLKHISDSGEKGLTLLETAKISGVSIYGVKVLLEIALGMNIIKVQLDGEDVRFVLGKIGWFFLEDEMTKLNLNFVNDVCYKGAFDLSRSVAAGKPLGLQVFGPDGEWKTIYEAFSSLPEQVKKSWSSFNNFYSDSGFEEALSLVFSGNPVPEKIIDIGGNTAAWAIRCCHFNPHVEVLIVDLPGQTALAEKEIALAGFSGRISTFSCNILDSRTVIPAGAPVIWMSHFLDCFSLEEIKLIMAKVKAASAADTYVYILEPFWDKQRFPAAAFLLQATSLYFTCIANGKSKMYHYAELASVIEEAGFEITDSYHNLGSNDYSLLRCRKKP